MVVPQQRNPKRPRQEATPCAPRCTVPWCASRKSFAELRLIFQRGKTRGALLTGGRLPMARNYGARWQGGQVRRNTPAPRKKGVNPSGRRDRRGRSGARAKGGSRAQGETLGFIPGPLGARNSLERFYFVLEINRAAGRMGMARCPTILPPPAGERKNRARRAH